MKPYYSPYSFLSLYYEFLVFGFKQGGYKVGKKNIKHQPETFIIILTIPVIKTFFLRAQPHLAPIRVIVSIKEI